MKQINCILQMYHISLQMYFYIYCIMSEHKYHMLRRYIWKKLNSIHLGSPKQQRCGSKWNFNPLPALWMDKRNYFPPYLSLRLFKIAKFGRFGGIRNGTSSARIKKVQKTDPPKCGHFKAIWNFRSGFGNWKIFFGLLYYFWCFSHVYSHVN